MRYENNEYLRRWLLQGGAYEYASLAHFDFEDRALEAATAEVQQQHPYLSAPEACARAAYRLLTKHRCAPGEVVAPLRARLIGVARRNAWRAAKVAWAVAVLAALLLLAARAKAEPPPPEGSGLPPGVRAAVLARGLFAQQPGGLIVQFQNQGSVLSTRPAGLVVLNCSTNMSCSFSGSTFTLTSSSTASTAFSAITAGTNTNALTMGTGGTFTFSGTGIVNANQYKGGNASGTGSCGANLFVTALADAASPTCTQPAFSNLSGTASSGQVPHALLSAFHTDTTAASVVRGDLIAGIGATPTWQRVARGGTNGYPKWNSSGDLVASSGAAAGTGACAANQFETADNADAAPTCAQPAFSNLGGTATKAQLPATTVYTDQTNTYSAGTQDFESAAVARPFRRLAFASFPGTCTANREFLERSDPAAAGQVVYVCNAAGTGWDLVGDGGGGGASTWNSITNPNGAQALTMGANNTTGTWDSASGVFKSSHTSAFTTGPQFLIEQVTGVPTGGTLLEARAATAAVTAFKAGDGTGFTRVNKDGTLEVNVGAEAVGNIDLCELAANGTDCLGFVAPTAAIATADAGRYQLPLLPAAAGFLRAGARSANVSVLTTTTASGTGGCTNQFARTLNDAAAPTCASVAVADVSAPLKTWSLNVTLDAPTTGDTNKVPECFVSDPVVAKVPDDWTERVLHS